jgi:methionyl-tRNA formyltransferase
MPNTAQQNVRLVYMGTAEFAVPTLHRLVSEGYTIAAVVTQPDKPSGRGQLMHASPVKRNAHELQLNVHQPATLKDDSARVFFEELQPDCIIVVAYGKLLPPWLIRLPRVGVVNLHGSLLPKYRGAAPIQWAVANGETETGVCTMQIDEGLDTGPVYLCEKTAVQAEETIPQLSERLAGLGAELTVRTLSGIVSGSLHGTPQDHSRASLAPILRKEDGYVDWRWPAETIHNRVRAFNPWPGTVTQFRGSICRILKSKVGRLLEFGKPPGSIIASRASSAPKGLVTVACGDGVGLELIEVQLPGKKPVSGSDFANGMRIQPGDCFELEVRQLS